MSDKPVVVVFAFALSLVLGLIAFGVYAHYNAAPCEPVDLCLVGDPYGVDE